MKGSGKGRLHYSFKEKILLDLEKGGTDLLEGRLARAEAKSLIIWGANDQILHVYSVDKLEKELKESRTVSWENGGHVPYFEQHEKVVQVCGEFLASVPGK